ncbi:hypothetical protein HDV05_002077, partial [Chytridiales sp. JEL 0842]
MSLVSSGDNHTVRFINDQQQPFTAQAGRSSSTPSTHANPTKSRLSWRKNDDKDDNYDEPLPTQSGRNTVSYHKWHRRKQATHRKRRSETSGPSPLVSSLENLYHYVLDKKHYCQSLDDRYSDGFILPTLNSMFKAILFGIIIHACIKWRIKEFASFWPPNGYVVGYCLVSTNKQMLTL